jgi:hypothetical protein
MKSHKHFRYREGNKIVNMTKAMNDSIVDMLHAGGLDKMNPKEFAAYRALTNDQKKVVYKAAHTIFEFGQKPLSSHPSIRALGGTKDISGNFRPYGPPSMHFPHVPHGELKWVRKVVDDPTAPNPQFDKLYKQEVKRIQTEDPTATLTKESFFAQLVSALKQTDEIEAVNPHFQFTRKFDPTEGGKRRASAGLEEYGYITDVMQAQVKYSSAGWKFAEIEARRAELLDVTENLRAVLKLKMKDRTANWVKKVRDFALGKGQNQIIDSEMQDWVSRGMNWASFSRLSYAGISNLAQLSYLPGRAGLWNTIKGINNVRKGIKSANREADLAGATYMNLRMEAASPTTALGAWTQAMFRSTLFPVSERGVRVVAGAVGNQYLNMLIRKVGAGTRVGFQEKRLAELGIDGKAAVKQIQETGNVDYNTRLRFLQTFAGRASGKQDISTLPMYAASHDPGWRAFTQWKDFMLHNTGDAIRQFGDAPNPVEGLRRLAVLAGVGELSGEVVNDIIHVMTSHTNPFTADRVYKNNRELFGDSMGRVVENLMAGLGNAVGFLLVAAAEGKKGILEALVPPVGNVGLDMYSIGQHMVTGDIKGLNRDAQYKIVGAAPIAGRMFTSQLAQQDRKTGNRFFPSKGSGFMKQNKGFMKQRKGFLQSH